MMAGTKSGGQRGIALIAVLWMLMIVGVIGASLIHLSQAARRSAVTEVNRVQARLLADAAINRVILGLVTPAMGERRSFDGTPQPLRLFDTTFSVRVESEAGKIDLGASPAAGIAALFRSLGESAADADLLATRVEEWRSPSRTSGPDIAADPYRQAEMTYGPPHRPFRSVAELRMVAGMTDALFARARPLVTVYSHLPAVDLAVASDGVLRALVEAGDSLARDRRRPDASGAAQTQAPIGTAVTISAAVTKGDMKVERRAVIRLIGSTETPFLILAWD